MTTQIQIDKVKADVAVLEVDAAPIAALTNDVAILKANVESLVASPPPVLQPLDLVTIYDGPLDLAGSPPSGISKKSVYQNWLPWKNVGGDWVDANGTPQGTVPFFILTPKTGQIGTIQADVTALIKQDTRMLLRGVGQETCVFYSRGTGKGPVIIYDTPTGQVTSPCVADDECNPTTEYEQGDSPTLSVTLANGVYISFPAAPAGWTKATLQLTISREYTGGVINGYKFAWGGLPPLPNATDTLSLKSDPRVFFETPDFTDVPAYLAAQLFGDPKHSMNLDKYGQRNIVDTPDGKALQVTFDPRVNAALVASILFPNGDEVDEAAVEFDMRIMPDMLVGLRQGFKCFAGFRTATRPDDAYFSKIWGTQVGRTGTLAKGNGGAVDREGIYGWSARFDMMKSSAPDHPMYGHFAPMQYVYWPEQVDSFGDARLWNGAGFTPKAGEWHRYTTRLKINTCVGRNFSKDAEYDAFLDGVLTNRWRGFYLRKTDDPMINYAPLNVQEKITYDVRSKMKIASIWLNGYHGGLLLPSARCSYQVRNLRIAKFA